jgi:hypothetical protein
MRRVSLTPDELPRQLDRARQGLLVKLPRAEFEDLVRQAALAEAARKNPPRLVGAYYHAELSDGALVGSLQWKVIHTAAAPGLLPLTPLTLALRQPRFENADAFIGDFDGHDPSLLVETPGEHAASVEWSARGEARPDELQFDLRFPASPAAVLELDLPADRVAVADGGGVTGPRPAGAAGLNRWTVACGGRSQLSLRVRTLDRAPVLRAVVETTQTLSPEGLDATYAFALTALHQGVRELTFECDAALRPYEVDAPDLEKWEVAAAGPDDTTVLLIVRLAQPLEEGEVRIHCLAQVGGPARGAGPVSWASPGVRLVGGVAGPEALTLDVHPDLRLADVEAGAFRLKEAGAEADADRRRGGRRLVFVGGGVSGPGAPAGRAAPRPRLVLYPQGVEFRARQVAWWRLDSVPPSVKLQTTYDVSQGRLFQLAVRLPPDWDVGGVDMAPAGLMRNWAVRTENGAQVLVVDLGRALTAADRPGPRGPTLSVTLQPARPGDVLGKEMAFPDAEPLGARFREGALAIGFDARAHRLEVKTAAAEAAAEDDGPWGQEIPAFYYPYRDISGAGRRPLAGTATLRRRPPQVRAQCTSEVVLSAGRALVDTRLLLQAEQGSPESVDLYLSAPAAQSPSGDPWEWRTEQGGVEVRAARRLHGAEAAAALGALAAGDALGAAALEAARPHGEVWRLTFSRPLPVHEPVVLHAVLAPKAAGDRLPVPLTAVLGAGLLEGETTVHLAAASPLRIEAFGLREASPAPADRPRGGSAWRTFRYGGAAVGLTLVGQVEGGDRPAELAVPWAELTTWVRPDGGMEHHYAFEAAHWAQNTLPLQLPPGAVPLTFHVDGMWLPHVPAVEEGPGQPVIDLPWPARPGEPEASISHHYEVVYTTAAAPGWWGTRAEAKAPSPPAPPAAFRRRWQFAPEFSPLGGGLRRLPGPGEGTPSAEPARMPADLFRAAPALPSIPGWPPGWTWDEARRPEVLPDALRSLWAKAGQKRPLGLLLNDAAAALRQQNRQFLVVDAAALAGAGVAPGSEATLPPQSAEDETPPWEPLGLAAAPARGGYVLTTRRQRDAWAQATGAADVPDAVQTAAADAARWGNDASGRFRAAPLWGNAAAEARSPLPSPAGALAGFTEWAPAPGGDMDAVVLVHRPLFDAAGWALAAVLGLVCAGAAWRWRRARLVLLLLWLGASGLGLLWLPPALQGLAWPALLVGCVYALGWRLWSAVRGPAAARPASQPPAAGGDGRAAAPAAVGAALLLLVLGQGRPTARGEAAADPAAPEPPTVFLVATPGDDAAYVLAPPDLVEQLRGMARPGAGPAAVPVNAEYTGEVEGGAAEFTASFGVVCFSDEPTTVALPLDGVQLCAPRKDPSAGEVLVDGTHVDAAALPGPQAGLAVPVKGRTKPGEAHRVELHFRTPVTGTDEERGVQFTAPRLAQSRMVVRLPKGSAHTQAAVKYGAQKISNADPPTLEVELGRVLSPLHVRWVPEAWIDKKPEVQVREAYLWDLGADSSRLTALLSCGIAPGAAPSLAVRLPEELEALSAEARRSRDGAPVRLRDLRMSGAGANRTLTLEFASPVSGDIDVALELSPRAPWPPSFVLPLPAPVLPPSPQTGKPPRPKGSFLAYRTHGLEVERVNPVGVTGVPAEQFAPFWPAGWSAAPRADPGSLAYASTLSREDDARSPVLGLKVRPSPPAADARVDMELVVGAARADVRAAATLAAPAAPSVVQWQVRSARPFLATDVSGPRVRRWNQEGDRVLVWLDAASKGEADGAATPLQLTGWTPLAPTGPDASRLDLPNVRLATAATQETTVRLVPGDGVSLSEIGRPGLAPAEPKAAAGVLAYSAGSRDDYGGAWAVQSGAADVRVYTVCGLRDRRLAFVAVVDCKPPHGTAESLIVRVNNWTGEVLLTAPPGVRGRERKRGPDAWEWVLERDPGAEGRLRVVLTGQQPGEAAGGATAPDVTVPGAAHVQRWAAVAGGDLTAEAGPGLAPADGPGAPPADLAAAAEGERLAKSRTAWRVVGPDWRLNLAPRDAAAAAAPIEVYLADCRAALADGRRWLHEAVYWLRHEANTDLNLTFPADAEVLSVTIDDEDTAPLQSEPRRLWLPLAGRPVVCRVRVRWRYAAGDPARPEFDPPVVQGAAAGPALWTVLVPPGWAAEGGASGLLPGLREAAAVARQRAEAQYHISAALAQRLAEGAGAEPLAAAQRRFYAECRRAKAAWDVGGNGAAWGPARSPQDPVQALLDRNKELAAARGFEALRAEAEKAAEAGGAAPEARPAWEAEGVPLYARADAGAAAPTLTLTPEEDRRAREVWPASAAWLGLLALVGLLALSPSVMAWARALWPEQVGLVGLLGWWAAGATIVVLVLLLLAAAGRVWAALRGFGRLFRHRPAKSKSTAPMPAAAAPSGA